MSWPKQLPKTDITGKQFGRVTALSISHTVHRVATYWLCKCQCGGLFTTQRSALLSGRTKSCGCSRRGVGRPRGPMAKLRPKPKPEAKPKPATKVRFERQRNYTSRLKGKLSLIVNTSDPAQAQPFVNPDQAAWMGARA